MRALPCLLVPCLFLVQGTCLADEERSGEQVEKEAGAEPIQLRYRFESMGGKVAVYTIETEQRVFQEVRSGQRKEKGSGEVVTWVRETLEQRFKRADRGRGLVEMTTKRIEARLKSAEQEDAFDSASDEEPLPGTPMAQMSRKLGRIVKLEVSRLGEVEKVRGVKVSERKAYKGAFLELPKRRLRPGDTWERLEKKPLSTLGSLSYFFRYELKEVTPGEGERAGRRRIEGTVRVLYQTSGLRPDASVKILKQSGGGHVILDEHGLMREHLFESELEFEIKSSAGVQVQRVKNKTTQLLKELRAAE